MDDARNPFEDDWLNFSPIGRNCLVIWAQSYQEAIQFLEKDWPDAICLDHDLGEEESGYDIAKYIVVLMKERNFHYLQVNLQIL